MSCKVTFLHKSLATLFTSIRFFFSMHPCVVYMLYVFPYENFAAIILPFYQKIIMLTAVGGLEEEGFFTISG